jgi:hypothetical protein
VAGAFSATYSFDIFINVLEEELSQSIVQALVAEEMSAELLPELTDLTTSRGPSPRRQSVWKAAEQFVDTRKLSGRTVKLT